MTHRRLAVTLAALGAAVVVLAGEAVAVASDTRLEHLWTVHANGSGLAPVGPLCPAEATEATCPDDTDPSFGLDSRQLTFVQASGTVKTVPGSGGEIEHSAIAVANVDGTGRRVVYQTAPYSSDVVTPMLSPHGAAIVFERDNSSESRPAWAKAVFVVRADGTHAHRLTPSPDGHSIVFATGTQGGNIGVYTMRLDGTHVRRLTRSKLWDSAPDWGSAAASADRVPASAAAAFPSGTWRVTVTTHDLVSRGVTGSDVPGNRGFWNWKFAGTTWTEQQQEKPGGVITDVHHGRIAVRGARVCFTDTGEHFSIGCYAWSRSGSALRFSKPTFRGPLAIGDGPGILKSIFIVHPWLHSTRAVASAAPTTISFGACAFGSGTATVPAGPVTVHLPGYADGTHGLLNEVVKAQTTTLTVSGPDGSSTRDLSALWSTPVDTGLGFWVIRQPDQPIGVLAPGQTVTVTYDVTFRHPTAIVFPPVGPTGFNGPFVITEDGPYTCEVTA